MTDKLKGQNMTEQTQDTQSKKKSKAWTDEEMDAAMDTSYEISRRVNEKVYEESKEAFHQFVEGISDKILAELREECLKSVREGDLALAACLIPESPAHLYAMIEICTEMAANIFCSGLAAAAPDAGRKGREQLLTLLPDAAAKLNKIIQSKTDHLLKTAPLYQD